MVTNKEIFTSFIRFLQVLFFFHVFQNNACKQLSMSHTGPRKGPTLGLVYLKKLQLPRKTTIPANFAQELALLILPLLSSLITAVYI